jgi:CHAD domain-containing protein
MAFRIEADEKLPEGIRRIACEQIERASLLLAPPVADRDEAIHNVRKCFKKIRGTLRLVRDEIGEEVYTFENRCFRDLGRKLAAARDVASMMGAAEMLLKRNESRPGTLVVQAVLDRLKSERDGDDGGISEIDQAIAEVHRELEEALERAKEWPVERNRFAAIDGGLKRIYRMGRRAFFEATSDPTMKNLHEWRKEVKYLWYCARILERMWPEIFDAMTHELHALADDLGDDHDLAMLRQRVHDRPELVDNEIDIALLFSLIDERRDSLQESAKSRGARIYSEQPKRFIRRMRTYWKAWQEDER